MTAPLAAWHALLMKTRHFVIILVVVLAVGGTAWWLNRSPTPTASPSASAEIKPPIAQVSSPAKTSTAIAAPIRPPATALASLPPATLPEATATKPAVTPALKEELNAMLTDLAALSQAGDMLTIIKNYTPPEELAETPPEKRAEMERILQIVAQNPDTLQIYHAMGEAYALLKNQTPALNTAGDEATYQLTIPPGSLPPGMTDEPPRPVTFQKINGRWYLKRDAGG